MNTLNIDLPCLGCWAAPSQSSAELFWTDQLMQSPQYGKSTCSMKWDIFVIPRLDLISTLGGVKYINPSLLINAKANYTVND